MSAMRAVARGGGIAARLENIRQASGVADREVADLLSTTAQTISRWRQGKAKPQREHLDRLLRFAWLVQLLSEFYSPDEARLWLYSPHKLLDGDTPADRIKTGRIQDVVALVNQLQSGAYV